MKRYARMALSCLLAAVLTVPLLACGASEADKGPKKDMSAVMLLKYRRRYCY